jgi:methyltransferase (TIGR00027 family)
MSDKPSKTIPDNTAVRVALWRALHLELDASPPVLKDDVGLKLAAPAEGWRQRGDMHPMGTRTFRAAIVARARFIEDLVEEEAAKGVDQYVIQGAGLDSFAQRHPELLDRLSVYEIDQPETQAWKRQRLIDLGYGIPSRLKLVPVNFEAGGSWPDELARAGFDATKPAVVVSTGVSLYLTREANKTLLRQVHAMAPGTTFAMTFILPIEMCDPEERPGFEASIKGAAAAGTPFVSFFTPDGMLALAREAGFTDIAIVSGADLNRRYFAGRSDGLRTSNSEATLVARV